MCYTHKGRLSYIHVHANSLTHTSCVLILYVLVLILVMHPTGASSSALPSTKWILAGSARCFKLEKRCTFQLQGLASFLSYIFEHATEFFPSYLLIYVWYGIDITETFIPSHPFLSFVYVLLCFVRGLTTSILFGYN